MGKVYQLWLIKQAIQEVDQQAATALGLLETVARDCMRIGELRPVA